MTVPMTLSDLEDLKYHKRFQFCISKQSDAICEQLFLLGVTGDWSVQVMLTII